MLIKNVDIKYWRDGRYQAGAGADVPPGYAPIPVRGKAPILNDWPAIVATKEVVERLPVAG